MHAVDLVIGLSWLAFWLYWLSVAVGVKPGRTDRRQFVGTRVVIAVAVLLLFRIRAFRGRPTHDPWLAGVGLAILALGLGVAIWARVTLGSNWGTPMSQKHNPDLVTTGPYRWVRNPIYSGLILAMLGTAIAVSPRWLVVVALLAGYFVYSAVREQRFLEARFPQRYPAYKQSTKMLVPFVF